MTTSNILSFLIGVGCALPISFLVFVALYSQTIKSTDSRIEKQGEKELSLEVPKPFQSVLENAIAHAALSNKIQSSERNTEGVSSNNESNSMEEEGLENSVEDFYQEIPEIQTTTGGDIELPETFV